MGTVGRREGREGRGASGVVEWRKNRRGDNADVLAGAIRNEWTKAAEGIEHLTA
jgi:hypothetical protein